MNYYNQQKKYYEQIKNDYNVLVCYVGGKHKSYGTGNYDFIRPRLELDRLPQCGGYGCCHSFG